MRLNGWQRLWVVVFGIWAVAVAAWAILLGPDGTGAGASDLCLMWLIPAAFTYAFGWSVAWVRRGFHQE